MKDEKTPAMPSYLAPMVLFGDVAIAAYFWFFREELLGPDMEMIAAALAFFFIMGGLAAFMMLKKVSRKVL